MNLKAFITVVLLIAAVLKAVPQNLVKNPGFEEHTTCDFLTVPRYDIVKFWNNPVTKLDVLYYHACSNQPGFGVPSNSLGFQYPRSGDAYGAISGYGDTPVTSYDRDWRVYLQGDLKHTLQPRKYHVSFFVNRGNKWAYLATWQLGLHFKEQKVGSFSHHRVLEYESHILNDSGNYITDTVEWVEIRGTYKAKGNENYLIIGNFFSDSETDTLVIDNSALFVNRRHVYLIDNVSVIPYPYFPEDTLLCTSDTLELYPNIRNADFVWQDGSTDTNYTVTKPGTYWVEVITEFTSFKDSVQVSYIDQFNIANGADTVHACEGEVTILKASISGTKSYTWNNGDTTSQTEVSQEGWYWAEVSNGICTKRDSVFVDFDTLDVNLGNDTVICESAELILHVQEDNAQHEWQDKSTQQSYTVSGAGKLWVTVNKEGCTKADTIQVQTEKEPGNLLPEDTTRCKGESLQINVDNVDGQVVWQDGALSKNYSISKNGIYELQIINSCGTFVYPMSVSVEDCECNIYFPSAFSPTNDGINDYFKPTSNCEITEYVFSVYDRWGQRVYYSKDSQFGWDGTMNTEKLPQGLYFWRADYKLRSEVKVITGNKWGRVILIK